MRNFKRAFLLTLMILLTSETAYSQQNHSDKEQLAIQYHYFRVERSTLLNSVNFLSRSGAYIEFRDLDRLSDYWDWYYDFGVGFNQFEASESNTLENPYHVPYHLGFGLLYRFGRMKSIYIIAGVEGGSEIFATALSPTSYELKNTYSGRVKLGVGMYLMSLTAANAELQATVTYPVTPVEFDSDEVRYNLIGEGLLRIKFNYSSGWGFVGKARFEDYENLTAQRTYFNARLFAGVFFEW
ncbi:MAG: hypothetical protein HRT44_02175 [Bdellovibrionales bacterium]|nr:hypothetical protein [Bdellovibrionales bacterium]NQZ18053.1 hypothetical protein [Bdellovibrionales bacterium]